MTTGPGDLAAADRLDGDIEIIERPVDHPDAVRLLRAFHQEQVSRYGHAEPIDLDPVEYAPPYGMFAVAYRYGVPLGCGGYRRFGEQNDTIEIKKVYLAPQGRGRGAGRLFLTWLERKAAMAGARRIILETGVRNTAALRLFQSFGYHPIPAYVASRDPAINRAYAKDLHPPAPTTIDSQHASGQ